MKKTLSLLLCLIMVAAALSGCGGLKGDDKGAIIPVYLSTAIDNFDPAYALHDEAGTKVLSLLYEGLTYIDASGKMQKAMAKNWTYKTKPEEDYYMLEIELKETKWSDGRQVSADDYVFAWKRLLEPEFGSEAAAALYEIKNARAVKAGEMTIDDLGLYAADTTVLQVEFETDIDYNQFLTDCSSLALVPLREDKVVKLENWASNTATMVTNGPFSLKTYKAGIQMTLERNVYYYRDIDKEESLIKYVIPYRLDINFGIDAAAQLANFDAENGSLFFISELPLAARAARSGDVTISDTPITHTYVFNSAKAPFNKPEVRRALSLAVDRNALVNTVVYAKAAEGFTTNAAFRAASGALISASANLSEAKNLLSAAGVSSGKFTITIRENEVDRAVAEYCKSAWEQLGFTVSIEALGTEYYTEIEYDQYRDLFETAYRAGKFDVIAVDFTETATNVFNTLAIYSKPFSGSALDLTSGNFDAVPHIGGYVNESYDALMEEIFAEKTIANRTSKLVEAEKILANDMPVMPLFQYQTAYLISGELSGLKVNFNGSFNFNKVKLKDYLSYLETEAPAAEAEEAAE